MGVIFRPETVNFLPKIAHKPQISSFKISPEFLDNTLDVFSKCPDFGTNPQILDRMGTLFQVNYAIKGQQGLSCAKLRYSEPKLGASGLGQETKFEWSYFYLILIWYWSDLSQKVI